MSERSRVRGGRGRTGNRHALPDLRHDGAGYAESQRMKCGRVTRDALPYEAELRNQRRRLLCSVRFHRDAQEAHEHAPCHEPCRLNPGIERPTALVSGEGSTHHDELAEQRQVVARSADLVHEVQYRPRGVQDPEGRLASFGSHMCVVLVKEDHRPYRGTFNQQSTATCSLGARLTNAVSYTP